MTEFREVKSTDDINNSAADSITEFREVKSTPDDLRVEVEVGTGVQELRSSVLCLEVKNDSKKPPTDDQGPRTRTSVSTSHSIFQKRDHRYTDLCFKFCTLAAKKELEDKLLQR